MNFAAARHVSQKQSPATHVREAEHLICIRRSRAILVHLTRSSCSNLLRGRTNTTGPLDRRLPILTSVNDWVSIDAPQNCLKSRILRLWYGDSGGMATLIDHIASSRAVCLTRLTTPGPSSLPITLPTMPASEVPNLPKHVQSPHEPGDKAMPTWHRTPPPKLSQRVHLTELT